jgi:hypothetical protein
METLVTKSCEKVAQQFHCEKCDYYTYKKSSFDKHNNTKKHNVTTSDKCHNLSDAKVAYICNICEKTYFSRNGLWVHKKSCGKIVKNEENKQDEQSEHKNNSIDKDELILMLLKQNNEFLDIIKNGTNQIITNTNSNCMNNNKTFNLQVFLNETCKDAMNISDFIESVKLQVSDLENVGKVGYIEGISNIIIKNLKALDIDKRPVHCADQKREVMYVKDENMWEKEDETNKKLRKAIRMIAHKNICMFKDFRETYPDCEDYDSKKNDQYNKIVYESMGGKGDNDYEKNTKIIKKIAKAVGIEKA